MFWQNDERQERLQIYLANNLDFIYFFTSHKDIVWPQKSGIQFLDNFYGTFSYITLGACLSIFVA